MIPAATTFFGEAADDILRTARLSIDDRYRWTLHRRWGDRSTVVFIMLNPSTADATQDDPTIRRCIGFARRWGMGGLTVVNLYAYRATKPADLWLADDPVGSANDRSITAEVARAELVVAAWGANAKPDRIAEVLALPGMDKLTALDVTKDGQPRHPLYLRADLTPQPWRQP